MEDKEIQKKRLESVLREASFAPILKQHRKYCIDRFAGLTPYISYKDLINNKLLIKGCPIGSINITDSGLREIIIEYRNIEELVNDGWQLE